MPEVGFTIMKISLTFDIERDFPHVLDTYYGIKFGVPKILDVLESFKIKGTFFCTGNVAEHFPDKMKLIERKGNEIACHSLNHEPLRRLNYKKCYDLIKCSYYFSNYPFSTLDTMRNYI